MGHLVYWGVPSDTAHACLDKDMLFFHGKKCEPTTHVTVNDLAMSQPVSDKPQVQNAIADPAPRPSKPSTYEALPANPKKNWETTYATQNTDMLSSCSIAAKPEAPDPRFPRSQHFTKQYDHGTLFPQNNPFRDR